MHRYDLNWPRHGHKYVAVSWCLYVLRNTQHAGTKCMRNQNRAQVVHTTALTVHDKSCILFQFKKNRNLFLLMYVSVNLPLTKKEKDFKHLIQYFKPLLVSTLLNIPAVVTTEMFTKGKNLVINSVVYCKTAPGAGPNFLLFFIRVCIQMGITEQL